MDYISIDNVSFEYKKDHPVIKSIDWEIPKGEFHSLIGRSGCGKTTLLKIVAGLITPTGGTVTIEDVQVSYPSLKTGFVFQNPNLLEWSSVLENVMLPVTLNRKKNSNHLEFALEVLATVGLKDYSYHYPTELSGGQQSRVAIARALITEPALLLMDEPFAALDEMTRFKLNNDVLSFWENTNLTVIFVTHSVFESVYLSSRVVVMAPRPGRVVADIPLDENYPRTDEYRTTPEYAEKCRLVSAHLQSTLIEN